MTKLYLGIAADPQRGIPTNVVQEMDADGSHSLRGDFTWGDTAPGSRYLALAILTDFLGSEDEARKYYVRLLHRKVVGWDAGKPWKLTEAELEEFLGELQRDEGQLAAIRAQVKAAPPPVENEGGIGPGGVPFSAVEKR